MSFENYVRDLAYVKSGTFSDLVLELGEKSWQTHRVLAACHSECFRKALTSEFKESHTGSISLHDDPVYLNAIDCMVSYFHQAEYNCSDYTIPESLLHAQVAIIADKYICGSLYDLARTSFLKTIQEVDSRSWGVVAAFIYDYTTTAVAGHIELRDIVVGAVAGSHSVLQKTLKDSSITELLRSNADIATDLLLGGRHGSRAKDVSEHHFVCGYCYYSHSGSCMCPKIMNRNVCPSCGRREEDLYRQKLIIHSAVSCPDCDGFHGTQAPEPEFDF
ncbi:unnamed protein product [Periconia digitata]|uniref:BTB domain-containing protein n=1 Tax=Periconia digitata TaxID=1303443 RepID=A0A9W4TYW5_9PLEO|nr:unnamed protein product [Periconia digitata]